MGSTSWNRQNSGVKVPLAQQATDICLFLAIVIAPFFMGGRQAMGQFVLAVLACASAVAWAIHQWRAHRAQWKFTGAEPLCLIGVAILVLQCVPISPALLETISPNQTSLLTIWKSEHAASVTNTSWNYVSLTPADTWSNLTVIVSCLILFFVAVQRVRTVDDVLMLLRALVVSAFGMAAFGIVQFLFSNGKFFWVYENPYTDTTFVAKGGFTNANHFANFLAMTVPAQIFLLVRNLNAKAPKHGIYLKLKMRKFETICYMVSLGVTGLALLLSMSRGGIVMGLIGTVFSLGLLWRKSLLGAQATALVSVLAIASLGATLLFGDLAVKMVEQNFVELTSADLSQLDQDNTRRKIWEANAAGMQDYPVLGTGLGSHREVYWQWFDHPHQGKEFSHAESGYFQIGLETGITGSVIVALLWLTLLSWAVRAIWKSTDLDCAGIAIAALGAFIVNLLHSISDFVWYAPANMVMLLMFAVAASTACSLQRKRPAEQAGERQPLFALPRLAWGLAIPLALFLAIGMTTQKSTELAGEKLWHNYLRLTMKQKSRSDDEINMHETLMKRRIEFTLLAVEANPNAHRIQLHAGLSYLKLFALHQKETENEMPLGQIREAALTAFDDPESMTAWLNQPGVLGEGKQLLSKASDHFRRAIELCPVQSRPYLELSELVWLEGVPAEMETELIKQAVQVRPFDSRAQFALGRLHWLDGEHKQAIAHWKESFRLDANYRGHLIGILSKYVPASFFLEHFDPDRDALRQLKLAYSESADLEGLKNVTKQLGVKCVEDAVQAPGLQAEKDWLEAHECFAALEDLNAAYHCGKEAIRANPTSYKAHLTFGLWLYHHQVFEEAQEEFLWCHRKKPDIPWLKEFAEKSFDGKVEQAYQLVPASYEMEAELTTQDIVR